MHEFADRPLGTVVTLDAGLEQEFEDRLRDSSGLAARVAYGFLRQRQDAEDAVPCPRAQRRARRINSPQL